MGLFEQFLTVLGKQAASNFYHTPATAEVRQRQFGARNSANGREFGNLDESL